MTYSDKIGYLKGLIDGLGIDPDSKEGKVYGAIVSVLEEMVDAVIDLEDNAEAVDDELDTIVESISDLEEEVYEDYDDEDEDDDCDCECDDVYCVVCPTCGEEIVLEEEMLEQPGIKCPACGEDLEFEFDEDCGCDECCSDHEDNE